MEKAIISTEVACACSLFAMAAFAYPMTAKERMSSDVILELTPTDIEQIMCPPHQIAVCDLICTGTITSTNDGYSAVMAVDEILWGTVASSNITVRYLADSTPIHVNRNAKYLIMAFTNDWWFCQSTWDTREDPTFEYLYDYLTPTSRPPSGAVFDDCRIMTSRSIFDFNRIERAETNYWPEVRTFITNYLEIAKIQHDEKKAHAFIYSLFNDPNAKHLLPPPLFPETYLYYVLRYKWLPPPDEMDAKPVR